MPLLKILVNKNGDVIGTSRVDSNMSGNDAPKQTTMVAGPGQRVIEIEVDEKTLSLDAGALHKAIKTKHLKGKK